MSARDCSNRRRKYSTCIEFMNTSSAEGSSPGGSSTTISFTSSPEPAIRGSCGHRTAIANGQTMGVSPTQARWSAMTDAVGELLAGRSRLVQRDLFSLAGACRVHRPPWRGSYSAEVEIGDVTIDAVIEREGPWRRRRISFQLTMRPPSSGSCRCKAAMFFSCGTQVHLPTPPTAGSAEHDNAHVRATA